MQNNELGFKEKSLLSSPRLAESMPRYHLNIWHAVDKNDIVPRANIFPMICKPNLTLESSSKCMASNVNHLHSIKVQPRGP